LPEAPAELRAFAESLLAEAGSGDDATVTMPLDALDAAVKRVARSWSESNLGHHSRVYYRDFRPPPPGAHFDSEWGFRSQIQGTRGDWIEYDPDDVIESIHELAGSPSLEQAVALAQAGRDAWRAAGPEIVSILSAYLAARNDVLIADLRAEVEGVRDLSPAEATRALIRRGEVMTRDSTAASQGFIAAPHQQVEGRLISIRSAFGACKELARGAQRAANHIERLEASSRSRGQGGAPVGDKVFIGHGRSLVWRELKDYINDRLGLPWDEFNRVPVAGVTNIARLSEMLDDAVIAFIVLTAEDERTDGREVARQNVVHEAGLFQGRLGFTRGIVLLEDGCGEFSNIQGLGQIRFPEGRISAVFEEVRRVLEREGFIEP
jgi:hypothetical protein